MLLTHNFEMSRRIHEHWPSFPPRPSSVAKVLVVDAAHVPGLEVFGRLRPYSQQAATCSSPARAIFCVAFAIQHEFSPHTDQRT